jgi:ABC-2 type transport system permease protein
MKQKSFLALALAAIGVIFLMANVIGANTLSGVRLDATHDRLYTVSAGTKSVVNGLDERITFDFYASSRALSDDPVMRTYAARVRDLLKAYSAISNGKIRLREHDPAPFSQVEDEALANGLKAAPQNDLEKPPLYLGLVVRNSANEKTIIPFFALDQEASLEYDITRAIATLTNPERPRVAVISSLPWLFSINEATSNIQPVAKIAADLAASYDVVVLAPDFDQLPPNTSALLIVQPPQLSEFQLYLLDQFALSQGRIIVALDPASSVAKDGGGGIVSASQALGPLAQAWGFSVQGDVILDQDEALPVQAVIAGRQIVAPQPLFFAIPPEGLSKSNLATAGLKRGLHVGTPGEVVFTQTAGLSFDPLLTSTNNTMRMDPVRALSGLTPEDVASLWEEAGTRFTLGASITGAFKTAFPIGPPATPTRSAAQEARFGPRPALPPQIRTSQRQGQITVIGDVDLFADSLYLTPDGEAADNAAFIQNAMDVLTGSDALISLRSRTPSARPLLVVERIKAAAQARLLEEQQQLQTRLETATARLEELEAKGAGAGFFSGQPDAALTSAEQAEMSRFREEVLQTRKRLRAVQEGVQASVAQIKTLLIVLNAIAIPILVALAGVFVFIARRMKARRARRTPIGEQIQAEVEALP